MPAGVTNPVLGYAGFCAIKLAGYSLAGWYLSRSYSRPDIGAFRVAATRTLIGMATGAIFFGVWWASGQLVAGPASYLYWAAAGATGRMVASHLDLLRPQACARGERLAQRQPGARPGRLLDAPAIAGLLAAGGFWVC
jgi:hypothetical protein